MTKFLNISTDNTLGGNSPSDVVVSSQKALKEYIDSHGGGGGGVSSLTDIAIAGAGIQFEGGSSVNYTLYGTPTVDSNYVASNFSASNRILPTMVGFAGQTFANLANSYPWEFKTKINLTTIGVWNAIFGGIAGSWGIDFYVDSSNRLAMNLSSNGTNYNLSGGVDNVHGTTTLSANTDYWLKCGWNGSKYYAELSTDGTNYTTGELSFTSSTPIYSSSYDTYLGFRNEAYLHGSISLPDTSFSFNNGQFKWDVVGTGKTIISSVIKTNNLFDNKWCDYELNDQNWLRADTFSWQDGTVYSEAYSHLVDDYTGGTAKTETVGSYTISYVEATDGHKITTDGTTVANIYAESSVAWYYVLDTTNTRFKLPRSSHGNIVEKYQNGSSWYRVYSDGWCEQGARYATSTNIESISFFKQFANVPTVFASVESTTRTSYVQSCIDIYNLTTSGFTKQYLMNITDGWAWMACGYLSSFPSNGQYKNLYFYVGEFSQSATEQTAGLNSSLFNNKMDIDIGNATSSAKEAIVGFNIPNYANGSGYTENTTFYADKDYYVVCSVVNGNYYGNIYADSALQTNLFGWQFFIQASANSCRIPVCVLPKGTYYTSNAYCFLFPFKGETI